ncbi:MAG: GT4 family glycosyltransferase PelF [Gemmataceae bacterium]|nr:GT4 family glycosyltransferase PelF [Gemmataceae bacterium]MCI0739260.1 GT4 family glycosyltransferase PelF [Gemmataceae bacterium]
MSHKNGKPAQPLHVVHVSRSLNVGGQERLLVEFARHAERARFRLSFVSLTDRGALAPLLEEFGWPVLALDNPEGLQPELVLQLARLFRRLGADIVHTHDDKPLLYGAAAVKLARVSRLVHTQHHGKLDYITDRQRFLVRWAGRLADAFVCVSHASARQMRGEGMPDSRLFTIWNGIDLERFSCCNKEQASGPAVTVARLSPEKDIANLLRAAQRVLSAVPGFHLEIAGDGPCRAELEALSKELGIADRVKFLGEIRNVQDVLSRARLFVLPSRTEGISLTLLEAMACGLPVVATDVGGNPELVEQEKTGCLVAAGDPEVLAAAIARLWDDAPTRLAMAQAGRRRVEEHFDVRRMIAQYEGLYRPVAHRPSRSKKGMLEQPTSEVRSQGSGVRGSEANACGHS